MAWLWHKELVTTVWLFEGLVAMGWLWHAWLVATAWLWLELRSHGVAMACETCSHDMAMTRVS